MTNNDSHPWLHRFALLTACAMLLPIGVGAMVTTLDAGMAFADWPTSDGHGMLAYPWLKSVGDKFIEHGHRLAGMFIGVVTMALSVFLWRYEPRRWVRVVGMFVLGGVVLQGLLGGLRVLADQRLVAWLHGAFAACLFALAAVVAVLTSRSWWQAEESQPASRVGYLKPFAVLTSVLIFAQYLLGGVLRHLDSWALPIDVWSLRHVHLTLAFVVFAAGVVLLVATQRCRVAWLSRPALVMLSLIVVQIALGAAAWLTKYGLPATGYVAQLGSVEQTVSRTAHMLCGVLLFMTSVVLTVRVFRVESVSRHKFALDVRPSQFSQAVSIPGGLA